MREDPEALDHIYDGYELESLLTAAYETSEYRFGTVTVEVRASNIPQSHKIYSQPSRPGVVSYTAYGLQTVMHPARGVVLLGAVPLAGEEPDHVLPRRIRERFEELTWLESVIRERLETDDFWIDRPIAMGVGVVTGRTVSPALRPDCVPEAAMIDRPKLPDIAEHIDTLLDYYTTESARPVESWAPKLIEELTDRTAGVCYFIGEDSLIESYEQGDREFDGLVQTAA